MSRMKDCSVISVEIHRMTLRSPKVNEETHLVMVRWLVKGPTSHFRYLEYPTGPIYLAMF